MRAEDEETKQSKATQSTTASASTSQPATTRRSSTADEGEEKETQGDPKVWIDPVRRGLDVIPRYNPKVVEGTMRKVNEINYMSWRMRTRWEHGTEYQQAEPAEMPDAFLQLS